MKITYYVDAQSGNPHTHKPTAILTPLAAPIPGVTRHIFTVNYDDMAGHAEVKAEVTTTETLPAQKSYD